jgi:Na+-driven multidrug efflux pump
MSDDTSFDAVDKKTRRSRKVREIALMLPAIGVVLLLTPILKAFTTDDETSSLTDSLLFIFGVWAILIVAAFFLSRVLLPKVREK